MQHSSLVAFLNGRLPPEALWAEIHREVTECLAACAKGGSGHVIMVPGPEVKVTREHVKVLLDALADCRLPLKAASYIADTMILSDDFEWDDDPTAVALFSLSDESRPLTIDDVEEERARLLAAS